MSRQKEIFDFLGADWIHFQELMRANLHSDVQLLEDTNTRILSNSGKMMRPAIALLIARMIGPTTEDSCRFAAAAEMLHNATLMHDDVADDSAERRGRPTLLSLLGPSAAVLVGDYWLARAVSLISASEHRNDVIPLFARTLTDLAEGEMLQLEKASSVDTTEDDYLRIIYCKTASLFSVAAETAAISVGATPEQRAAAKAYADAFGTAFQIKDDILDYAGTDALGKPVGVDLKEQKITLTLLGAMTGSPREAEIRAMVRDIPAHPEFCDAIRAFVVEREGIAFSTRKLTDWVARSEQALDVFPDSTAKEMLIHIAHYNLWLEV